MKKFALGMVALTGLAALAGSAEARERRFLFWRYDDGRAYSQPAYYQPAPQQSVPAAPPAQEVVAAPETPAAPAAPAAAPAPANVQVPATQPAQPLAVQTPMQQQQYYYDNSNYYNGSNGGGFFDRLMEFERRKNEWIFGGGLFGR